MRVVTEKLIECYRCPWGRPTRENPEQKKCVAPPRKFDKLAFVCVIIEYSKNNETFYPLLFAIGYFYPSPVRRRTCGGHLDPNVRDRGVGPALVALRFLEAAEF